MGTAPSQRTGAAAPDEARVLVGRIGAAHGLAGEVRLWPYTDDPLALRSYGALTTADGRRLVIQALRAAKDHLIARFEGVSDRNAAEALRNCDLFVPRAQLPAPSDGEFYHADLIGLRAETPDGVALGRVLAVHNFGAGDILEIGESGEDSRMIAFSDAAVPEVDLAAGRLVVALPEEIEGEERPAGTRP